MRTKDQFKDKPKPGPKGPTEPPPGPKRPKPRPKEPMEDDEVEVAKPVKSPSDMDLNLTAFWTEIHWSMYRLILAPTKNGK